MIFYVSEHLEVFFLSLAFAVFVYALIFCLTQDRYRSVYKAERPMRSNDLDRLARNDS